MWNAHLNGSEARRPEPQPLSSTEYGRSPANTRKGHPARQRQTGCRCRANTAHVRKPGPDSGLGFQENFLKVVPSSLGSGPTDLNALLNIKKVPDFGLRAYGLGFRVSLSPAPSRDREMHSIPYTQTLKLDPETRNPSTQNPQTNRRRWTFFFFFFITIKPRDE